MDTVTFDVNWSGIARRGAVRVAVIGSLTGAGIRAMRQVTDMLLDRNAASVEIDLSQVTASGSAGVAAIVLAGRRLRAHGVQVSVTGTSAACAAAFQQLRVPADRWLSSAASQGSGV